MNFNQYSEKLKSKNQTKNSHKQRTKLINIQINKRQIHRVVKDTKLKIKTKLKLKRKDCCGLAKALPSLFDGIKQNHALISGKKS